VAFLNATPSGDLTITSRRRPAVRILRPRHDPAPSEVSKPFDRIEPTLCFRPRFSGGLYRLKCPKRERILTLKELAVRLMGFSVLFLAPLFLQPPAASRQKEVDTLSLAGVRFSVLVNNTIDIDEQTYGRNSMNDRQAATKKRRGALSVRPILPLQLALNEKGDLIYPFQQIPKAKEVLFGALEFFANIGDNIEDLHSYRRQHPGFEPIEIRRGQRQLPHAGSSEALHPLILGLRDILRLVWRHDADDHPWFLDILLGLDCGIYREGLRQYEADPKFPGLFSEEALRCLHPYREQIIYSEIHSRWRTGDFEFSSASLFHKAVYQLFRESWRARICPQCARYFIAGKPPQLYCSTPCYGNAKRKRDLKWWRTEGAAKRRQKQPEAQGHQRKKKRGK